MAPTLLGPVEGDRAVRILVLGASGMAGHVIATHLADRGHEVTRTGHIRKATPDTQLIDLSLPDTIQRAWLAAHDVVVNAVGVLIGDASKNPAKTAYLNTYLPHLLAAQLADTSTRLIHLSTDCVFSGTTGGYRETSPPDSGTFYGRTKAAGEVVNGKDLTFRQSIIGPDLSPDGPGLFAWYLRQQGPVQGWAGVRWNGVTTLELACAIDTAIRQDVIGLYHLTPPEATTKHYLLCMIRDVFGCPATVVPVPTPFEDRTLADTRRELAHQPPDYPTMLRDLRAWIEAHPDLYSHYLQETR